jgi:hypothetical protein
MEEKLAKAISVIFHPLLIPSYLTLVVFNLNNYISLLIPTQAKLVIFSLILATTFVFPVVFVLIIKWRGLITSLQMGSREERVYPYTITGIFNFSGFYMLKQIQTPNVYNLVILGSAILILICLLINFYTKISAHLAGAGGLTGTLIGLSLHLNIDLILLIISAIFISGLIGFARLKLKAHKPFQIYAGFIIGMIVMTIFLLI